ncbi:transcription termination/antitermination protein NusA [Candidatus Uhrbacteria bacterium CG_4_9_14_3_um_filter_41_35]|uniref:Transcription termination/antitermination protein NusA n=1 Tax=Candidatus Uhrbacteria bacterium CG_4_9_14_3_um_filter_41_35 TaxID=1975034 RepID=A0A2M7XGB2_9BACT|nr:MAG: transcription termination/antitermination protein NusA [Candidatus Uhrbacteria bacterium CG_4_9_14_3_um_filter_41_35]
MASDIEQAIRQICEEKGLSYDSVIETIEVALAAAYRKDYGDRMQNIEIEFDTETGGVKAFDVKTVVDNLTEEEVAIIEERQAEETAAREAAKAAREAGLRVDRNEDGDKINQEEEILDGPTFNPKTEIMLRDAMVLKMTSKIGDVFRRELPLPGEFGRMAAMTAKQVITQKLREAEREIVFNEFKGQEGEVLVGTVQRREGRVLLVDLGRISGIMLPEDQIPSEKYTAGDRIKVYVREVTLGTRGPQILLSRTSEELVRVLFELEIPEIADGTVVIKAMAREAGARTKVAVSSTDSTIDPIGAAIGQRGVRIQTIINELNGEKIDVIEWSENPASFIGSALAPAKVKEVTLNEEERMALALVEEGQLSLAIGRGGQNVRLAAKLTGWKVSVTDGEEVKPKPTTETKDEEEVIVPGATEVIPELLAEAEEIAKAEIEEDDNEKAEEVTE